MRLFLLAVGLFLFSFSANAGERKPIEEKNVCDDEKGVEDKNGKNCIKYLSEDDIICQSPNIKNN